MSMLDDRDKLLLDVMRECAKHQAEIDRLRKALRGVLDGNVHARAEANQLLDER